MGESEMVIILKWDIPLPANLEDQDTSSNKLGYALNACIT